MKPRVVTSSKNQLEFALHENHPLRLIRARGRRVECVSGIAWITAYNQSEDIFLHPGMMFVVPNDGLTLIEAIGRCSIRVEQSGSLKRKLSGMLVSKGVSIVAGIIRIPQWARK